LTFRVQTGTQWVALLRQFSGHFQLWRLAVGAFLRRWTGELFPPRRVAVPSELFLTRIVIQNFVVNDFLNEEHR
jgi:hypothetical protein